MIRRYRDRGDGFEIEAVRFTSASQLAEIEGFADGESAFNGSRLVVAVWHGLVRATIGDWIIRGANERFYKMDHVIFEQVYEEA